VKEKIAKEREDDVKKKRAHKGLEGGEKKEKKGCAIRKNLIERIEKAVRNGGKKGGNVKLF